MLCYAMLRLASEDGAAELVVALERRLGEVVCHVGADVEDEFVAVKEVVDLRYDGAAAREEGMGCPYDEGWR